jgi:hypothetical protein
VYTVAINYRRGAGALRFATGGVTLRNVIAGFFLIAAGLWGQCSTLSTVTPNSVSQGSGITSVNFTGASFQPNEQIVIVYSGSSPQPVPTTLLSPTTGNAVLPAAAFVNAGTVQIFLGPPCQSNPLNITVTAQPQSCPMLTSLTPDTIQGVVVGTVEVDAAGSNFQPGDQATLSGTVVQTTVASDKLARVFVPRKYHLPIRRGRKHNLGAGIGEGDSIPIRWVRPHGTGWRRN